MDKGKIIIYGAGKMGRKSYLILKEQGYDLESIFFAVTKKVDEKSVFEKKIYELSDLLEDKDGALVLVSVSKKSARTNDGKCQKIGVP